MTQELLLFSDSEFGKPGWVSDFRKNMGDFEQHININHEYYAFKFGKYAIIPK